MKNIRKIGSVLLIAIMLGSNVFAADLKTALNVVEQASETKYLENNQGYISKTIVDSNPSTGEVTVELKLSNNNINEDIIKYEKTEIWIIDEETKENKVTLEKKEYTKQLCKKILSEKENVKIGIIGAKGPDAVSKNGSEEDAEYVSNLTNNYTELENNWNNMNKDNIRYATNHQAALRLASKSFSENVNKVVITLIDGVTETGIGFDGMAHGGGEESARKNIQDKASGVKKEMLKLQNLNVNFIVFRGNNENYIYKYGNVITIDANEYIDEMYGTVDSPYIGKIYMIDDSNLQEIITEVVYEDISKNIQNPINTVKVVDYFPEYITDNFEFSYVGEPSVGTVSEEIDTETNTITWDIDTLKGNEVATLQYKLKIKDMQNSELLNKTIATNEKVVLTYTDIDSEDYTVTLNSSPKIQLSEVKEENKQPNKQPDKEQDKTTATGEIPQTGVSMVTGISIVITLIALAIIYIRNRKYKDIK